MYKYFVSFYALDKNDDTILGNSIFVKKSPITTEKQIRKIEDFIQKKEKCRGVIILNYILLKKFGE